MVDVQTRRVTYAVLATGGFLGLGQALFAVPFESLTIGQGRSAIVLNARGVTAAERLDSLNPHRRNPDPGRCRAERDVESDDVSRCAEDLARQVAGVRQVDNGLMVRN